MRDIGVRYLVKRPLKGRTLWYWQPTPKLLAAGFIPRRLPDDRIQAIVAAERLNAELDQWRRKQEPKTGPSYRSDSLLALHDLFQADEEFMVDMAPRTQRDYLYNIKPALDAAGESSVALLERKMVKNWYRGLKADRGESAARNAIAALRRLLSFGVDEGWIDKNPALKMMVSVPDSRSRVWTINERDVFCAKAVEAGRPSMALAVMLGWCLGQRPADLRKLSWAAYDGKAVLLRQEKTGAAVWVPALPELRRLLETTPRVENGPIVVSEATGRPYAESDFQHRFAGLRALAGLPDDLQFRDLRRTLATALGAAGCSEDQIRAITGHKSRNVLSVYVRPDRTFAEGAMRKLRSGKRHESKVAQKAS